MKNKYIGRIFIMLNVLTCIMLNVLTCIMLRKTSLRKMPFQISQKFHRLKSINDSS